MSEQALAAWELLLQPELPALVARVSAFLGVTTARCLELLTPRELLALSSAGAPEPTTHHLGDSPAADSGLAGFFG